MSAIVSSPKVLLVDYALLVLGASFAHAAGWWVYYVGFVPFYRRNSADHVADLRQDEFGHREADGVLGPGSRKTAVPRAVPAQARDSIAALPISGIAQHPKELAESIDPLLEQAGDGFVGAVARGDTGAAGRDDHIHAGDLAEDRLAHVLRIVAQDLPLATTWPAPSSSPAIARPLVSVSWCACR